MLNIAPVKLGRGKVVHAMWTGNDAHRGYIVGGCTGSDVTPLADAETAITCRRCQNALPSWINVGPVAETSPLDACEHGTAPQAFCQGCYDTKPAYAAQVDKVRAIRARVVEATPTACVDTGSFKARQKMTADVLGITLEELQQQTAPAAPKLDDAHAEALTINDKIDQVARLEAHPSIEARRVAYEIRDEIMAAGFSEQAIADVPKRTVKAPKVEIHTAGELHPAPKIEGRVTFTFNLSDLLDDPLRKPDADLVKRTGLDPRMADFVFGTEGARGLFDDMVDLIERQVARGKDVTVLVLCRGGKHRSVAFGESLAYEFEAAVTHHHIDLPIVKYADK